MKIGIDLGGSHIGIGLINKNNEIMDKLEKDWSKEEKENLWTILPITMKMMIKELLEKNSITNIECIGIGVPRSRIKNGIVKIDENTTIDFKSILEPVFQTKVYVYNDVKCSGICEKQIGHLKNYENALFITLGTGIGGAYFYHNELVVPNTYPGLEVGHMVLQAGGKQCRCGKKGCFEEYASMRVFKDAIIKTFNIQNVTAKVVKELLIKKETSKKMKEIIDEYIKYLVLGLQNLISILEPDAIGIGGSFTYYEDILMNSLKEKLKQSLKGRTIPDIVVAKYKNDAGMIGAIMLEDN